MSANELGQHLTAALVDVVGPRHVLLGRRFTERYGVDWTGRYRGTPPAVVQPASTAEVSAVLRLCDREEVAVVPQGGNTGLVGGSVPRNGELVLSLARLQELGEVEPLDAQVTVGAGVTLRALQNHADNAGFSFPVDLGARDSATIGGMIATNAGGIHVLRYGSMRAQVMGLEAVLANGDVVDYMSGLFKDNTGFHLPSLLIGSEGTLAVITRARLRLEPRYEHRAVVLVGIEGTDAALKLVHHLFGSTPALEAAEVFYEDGLALVHKHTGIRAPFEPPTPAYLLLEAAGHRDPTDEIVDALADRPEVLDTALATDSADRDRLWRLREAHPEAVAREGTPLRFDIAVPRARLPEFEHRAREAVAAVAPQAHCIIYGHLGDGNLHVNVVGGTANKDELDEAFLRLVLDLSGTISAEHGIGVEKVHLLERTRAKPALKAMLSIKSAFDPHGILNPGVLFTTRLG